MTAQGISAGLTEVTRDFASSTGFTFNASVTEFVSGECRLKTSAGVANDTVQTPDISRSGWGTLVQCSITDEQEGNADGEYSHRFMFSVDGGDTWQRYTTAGWVTALIGAISGDGMLLEDVQAIRDWPAGSEIRVAIYMTRTHASADGNITEIAFGHGSEDVTVPQEYATDSTDFPTAPDATQTCRWIQPHAVFRDEGGYEQLVAHGKNPRLEVDLTWTGLTNNQKNTLKAYFRAHYTAAMTFNPHHHNNARGFIVVSEPQFERVTPGGSHAAAYWTAFATIREVLRN